jgi:cell wall-associated NlpC family hydrolase
MTIARQIFSPLIQAGIILLGLTCNTPAWTAEIVSATSSTPHTPVNTQPATAASASPAAAASAASNASTYKAALNASVSTPMSIASYTPQNSGANRNEDKLGELIARLAAEHAAADRPLKITGRGQLQDITNRASDLVMHALGMLGISYKRGGNTPESGLDCSGMVRYVFKQALGHELPRSAAEISQIGIQIKQSELQPGDLVFYNTMKNSFSHVGIYLGDGKFIHSPSAGGQVRIESMALAYWTKRFDGARRMPERRDE